MTKIVGNTYTVIKQDDFSILLEVESLAEATNQFVLIEAKSIGGDVDHGTLEVKRLTASSK